MGEGELRRLCGLSSHVEDGVQVVFTLLDCSRTEDFDLKLVLAPLSGESFEVVIPHSECKTSSGGSLAMPDEIASVVSKDRGIMAKSVKIVSVEGSLMGPLPPPDAISCVAQQLCEPPAIYKRLIRRREVC